MKITITIIIINIFSNVGISWPLIVLLAILENSYNKYYYQIEVKKLQLYYKLKDFIRYLKK
jgi:hypothetical protein